MNSTARKPRSIPSLAAVLTVALLGGCRPATVAPPSPPTSAPFEVKVTHPVRGAITRSIVLPAQVKAYQEATLYAKVTGYVKSVRVDKGDRVKEGDLLAELEVPELLADRVKFRAELEVAELNGRRLDESQAKAPDLVMPLTVDEARGKVAIAKANLDRVETLLAYARIIAPFEGVVIRRLADPGALIPAATSGTAPQNAAILTLSDFTRVRVQVAVPELEAPRVKPGLPVRFTVEGLRDRVFEGTVTRLAYALDESTRTMLAEVELPNPTLDLRPGMYATLTLGIERKEGALLVPSGALVAEKAGTFVFLVVEGAAKKTRVQTGFSDGVNTEVREGLTLDQSVVVVGRQPPADGQRVHVSEGP